MTTPRSNYVTAGATALALVLTMAPAYAQTADGGITTGLDLTPAPSPAIIGAAGSLDVTDDVTQLIPALAGIKIIGTPDQVAPTANAMDVVVSAPNIPLGVSNAAGSYIGRPVTPKSLDELTRDMVLAFRNAGMPVANVAIPPQDITNGTLQVIAVVAELEDIIVTGTDDKEYYKRGFTLSRGDVLYEAPVLDQLRWTSRRHNRSVEGIFAPGSEFGTTDLEFAVTETKPWGLFFGVDSSGTDTNGSIGEYRIFAGANYADLFLPGDELSYQLTTSEDGFDKLNAHVISYVTEFPWIPRTDIRGTLAYIGSESRTTVTNDGESVRAGFKFITQLPGMGRVNGDLHYGFDYKRTNNDSLFGGARVSNTDTEMGLLSLEYIGVAGIGNGQLSFNAGLFGAPGGIFEHDSDTDYNGLRANADSGFIYARGGIDYLQPIYADWRLRVELDAQITNDRLLPSEMFSIGGMDTVRGFDESLVRGDSGIVARIEAQAPSFTLDSVNNIRIRPFAFIDAGYTEVNGTPTPTESSDTTLVGGGLGARLTFDNYVSLEATYGAKIDASGLPAGTTADDDQLSFRMLARF